ncbi:MAG: sigma-70 family RNA polymerase sigma factor [Thermoguttaceae bacterium]|jgi:RNA polymerase sigma-70 factor (ECF subfamily)
MAGVEQDFGSLIARIQQGSEDAAWELVEQYGDAIRRAVRRVLHGRLRSKFDSLDFVQLVWNSFFKARDRMTRFTRPEELAAFLATMARNKVGMEIRRRLRSAKYDVKREESLDVYAEELDRSASRDSDPFEVAVAREQWNRLIAGQPHRYRQIISLRLQGVTIHDIAASLDMAESTVRRFLDRLLNDRVT